MTQCHRVLRAMSNHLCWTKFGSVVEGSQEMRINNVRLQIDTECDIASLASEF